MATYTKDAPASLETAVQRYVADFPAIRASVERERRKYAKHLVPVEELRADLSRTLGERRLIDTLYEMRGR